MIVSSKGLPRLHSAAEARYPSRDAPGVRLPFVAKLGGQGLTSAAGVDDHGKGIHRD